MLKIKVVYLKFVIMRLFNPILSIYTTAKFVILPIDSQQQL